MPCNTEEWIIFGLITWAAVMQTLALPPVFKRVVAPILERIWPQN